MEERSAVSASSIVQPRAVVVGPGKPRGSTKGESFSFSIGVVYTVLYGY